MTEQQEVTDSPTREQIAEAIYMGIHDWSELSEWNQKAYLARADAVLALLSQPTPIEHCLLTANHTAHEWGGHEGQAGTGYQCPGTSEPPRIEDMAPGTTLTGAMLPADRGGYRPEGWERTRRWFVFGSGKGVRVVSDSGWPYQPEDIDPSTIRDVTPPRAD